MKLIRAKTKFGIEMLKGLIKGNNDVSSDEMTSYLSSLLVEYPRSIFMVLAIDESASDDSKMLRGFVIGVSLPTQSHVVIVQIESDDLDLKNKLFHRLVLWSEGLEKTELRFEVFPDGENFTETWGFKPSSKIMTYDIKTNDVTKQLLRIGEELEPLVSVLKEDRGSKNADDEPDKLS